MARRHVMTPARQRALKKAQKESALKRRYKGQYRNAKSRAYNRKMVKRVNIASAVVYGAIGTAMAVNGYRQARRDEFKYKASQIRIAGHSRRMQKSSLGKYLPKSQIYNSPFTHKGGKTRRK